MAGTRCIGETESATGESREFAMSIGPLEFELDGRPPGFAALDQFACGLRGCAPFATGASHRSAIRTARKQLPE